MNLKNYSKLNYTRDTVGPEAGVPLGVRRQTLSKALVVYKIKALR